MGTLNSSAFFDDHIFDFKNFEDKIIRVEWCATTRKFDNARIRLEVCVQPCAGSTWYEVSIKDVSGNIVYNEHWDHFSEALAKFNEKRKVGEGKWKD